MSNWQFASALPSRHRYGSTASSNLRDVKFGRVREA
jgi:hypothetical protein